MRRFSLALAALLVLGGCATGGGFSDCDVCPAMVPLPPGQFVMGAGEEEQRREAVPERHGKVERPAHTVRIVEPFAMGRYEITQAQFQAFADDTGHETAECLVFIDNEFHALPGSSYRFPPFPQQADHPAICIRHADAVAYTDWLSRRTGRRYRLPSEAEWEYAARAGTATARYWGDGKEGACEHTNVSDESSLRPQFDCADPWRYTSPVDYGRPNAFGLYGVLGNVGEWTADCGLPDYRDATGTGEAVTSGDCSVHVGRGGAWWNDAHYLRSARRYAFAGAFTIVGFRVAAEVERRP